jgi:NADPH:quinone reductase-like Zn-dependent oxidoreductase
MRAAVISNEPASPGVTVRDWPEPTIPAGWALVELRRAALNRHDEMSLRDPASLPGPSVLGSDGAGVVAGVGEGVTGLHIGEEVVISPSLYWGSAPEAPGARFEILGTPTQGTHAEMVAVPAANLLPRPSRLSWDEAAALPLAGVTAWRALVTRGRLRAGETVIIAAASSGVGSLAVQIAAALGARVVAVTSERNVAAARSIGADHVLRRTSSDLVEELTRASDGGAHLALDPTGALWQPLLQGLRPAGRLVSVGRMASDTATVRVATVFWKQLDILGSSMGSDEDFRALLQHVEGSDWAPVVDSTHPLERISDAYARLNHPERFGKVVIDVSPERTALHNASRTT